MDDIPTVKEYSFTYIRKIYYELYDKLYLVFDTLNFVKKK